MMKTHKDKLQSARGQNFPFQNPHKGAPRASYINETPMKFNIPFIFYLLIFPADVLEYLSGSSLLTVI